VSIADASSSAGEELLFGRFEVRQELGIGAFGRVLLCFDRDSSSEVALKELHRVGGDAILHFKKEFRSLADVHHPNLVRMHELLGGEGAWAMVLEYVPGTDFLSYVRDETKPYGFDETRLREGWIELVHGLTALHTLGLMHRDVKPHNVRVTPEGRVVLLDFGLVAYVEQQPYVSVDKAAGTISYMAPEQSIQGPLGPPIDFYALGVLIYQALTGRLPFEGTATQILIEKHQTIPVAPCVRVPGISSELSELCMKLLARTPAERATARDVLAVLASGPSLSEPPLLVTDSELFIGRERELSLLEDKLRLAVRSGLQVVLIEGESGIGKSALMQRFGSACGSDETPPLVLRGRCHAAELIGYKAFDGAIDALSSHLKALDERVCRTLLPHESELLPVLFPVLGRVRAIGHASHALRPPRVDRYAMFSAAAELFARVSQMRPLLLLIDDLQWADEASFLLLKHLLSRAPEIAMCVVATVRDASPASDVKLKALDFLRTHKCTTVLQLGGLEANEAVSLAQALARSSEDRAEVDALARESSGHPMFMTELARADAVEGGSLKGRLDSALMRRARGLDRAQQHALELICVAGAPLPVTALREALGVASESAQIVLTKLSAQRLARRASRGAFVCYHERIREALLASLGQETRRARHRQLAHAFETAEQHEPARIAYHWIEVREHERALPWLKKAAAEAEHGGAYERAVVHYEQLLSLEGGTLSHAERHALALLLADALAAAGRCAESAHVLLSALQQASEDESRELSIRAAQRLLQAGSVDEGLAASRKACRLLSIPWPTSRLTIGARMLLNRARVRSLVSELDAGALPLSQLNAARDNDQLDALRRIVTPMLWADLMRFSELQSRYARAALRSGQAEHMAVALYGELSARAMQQPDDAASRSILSHARALRKSADSAELRALECYHRGLSATFTGNFREAESLLAQSERVFATERPGAVWELANARSMLLSVWRARGEYRRHATSAQRWIDDARLRGDRFAEAAFSVSGLGSCRHLQADQPGEAGAEIVSLMAPWRSGAPGIQQFAELVALEEVRAYRAARGHALENEDAHRQAVRRFERSLLHRMPFMRETLSAALLRTALIRACAKRNDAARLAEARALHKSLRSARGVIGAAAYVFYAAQLALLSGATTEAAELAKSARARFANIGFVEEHFAELLHAYASQAEDRTARRVKLLAWLESQGWKAPENALYSLLAVSTTFQ
jgi:serine/threonine protein kinase